LRPESVELNCAARQRFLDAVNNQTEFAFSIAEGSVPTPEAASLENNGPSF
jgi:hypothetical protein